MVSSGWLSWAGSSRLVTTVCDGCERPVTSRHHSAQSLGIRLHGAWYCGTQCFTAAGTRVIAELLALRPADGQRSERMPLGLLLVNRGLLTLAQLRSVAEQHREVGGDLGELLCRQGLVSERQVAAVRAGQWNCPVFAVPRHGVSAGILLAPALVDDYSAITLHHRATTDELMVGFVHSIDYGLLYAIEHVVGCRTQACFVTPGDFAMQKRAQGASGLENVTMLEAAGGAAAMARIVCRLALESEAHEAVMARCKHHLWVRLKRDANRQDLLFPAADETIP